MGPVAADLGCSSFREEPKFADSSLEEDGFEPSVPLTGRRSLSRKDEVPKGRTGAVSNCNTILVGVKFESAFLQRRVLIPDPSEPRPLATSRVLHSAPDGPRARRKAVCHIVRT